MSATLSLAKKQTRQILNLITSFPEFYLKKIDNFPVPVITFTGEGTIQSINQAYCEILEYEKDELIGDSFDILLPKASREERMKGFTTSYTHGVEFKDAVTNVVNKPGRQFPVIFSSMRLKPLIGEDNLHIATVVEISDESKVEELIQKTHESLQRNVWRIEAGLSSEELLSPVTLQEFSTPFENILKICEEIADTNNSIAQKEEWINVIQKICHENIRQSKARHAILEMEGKRFTPEIQKVEICQIVKDIFKPLHHKMENKDITYKLLYNGENTRIKQQSCIIEADPICFELLLSSLILNAVEASPEDEEICLSVMEAEDKFEISLHNKGAVPEEIRDTFFHKYSTSGKTNRIGLGTYFAHLITEAHQGQIKMETSQQEGTTISVCLPKSHDYDTLSTEQQEFQA